MSQKPPANLDSAILRLCPNCDYDLRGIQSARCPECGLPIDDTPSLIPWEHRKQIGRARALGRTVLLVLFKRRRLAQALAVPVDDSAAHRFRLMISLMVALPPAIIFLVVIVHQKQTDFIGQSMHLETNFWWISQTPRRWELATLWSAGATLLPILPIGLFIAAWLATGSARIWFAFAFSDSLRRRRAAVINSYACAPLVLLPIAWISVVVILILDPHLTLSGPQVRPTFFLCAAFAFVVLFALIDWWWGTVRLLWHMTHCGWRRLISAAIGIPLGWIVCAAVGLGLWPCIAGLVWIAIDSLRD